MTIPVLSLWRNPFLFPTSKKTPTTSLVKRMYLTSFFHLIKKNKYYVKMSSLIWVEIVLLGIVFLFFKGLSKLFFFLMWCYFSFVLFGSFCLAWFSSIFVCYLKLRNFGAMISTSGSHIFTTCLIFSEKIADITTLWQETTVLNWKRMDLV